MAYLLNSDPTGPAGLLGPVDLDEDALYLGVLTQMQVKPLSRLEYAVAPDILAVLHSLGLLIMSLTRIAGNGARCRHLILGTEAHLMQRYCAEFDGAALTGEKPDVVLREATYFGYPRCCANAYARDPHAPNSLTRAEQTLLFHHACQGCRETPKLIPLYRLALAQARRLHAEVRRARGRIGLTVGEQGLGNNTYTGGPTFAHRHRSSTQRDLA